LAGPGWYATLHGWEIEEGVFPSAHWWDGEKWLKAPNNPHETNAVILHWPQKFDTQEEALAFADANDPDR